MVHRKRSDLDVVSTSHQTLLVVKYKQVVIKGFETLVSKMSAVRAVLSDQEQELHVAVDNKILALNDRLIKQVVFVLFVF